VEVVREKVACDSTRSHMHTWSKSCCMTTYATCNWLHAIRNFWPELIQKSQQVYVYANSPHLATI